LSSRSIQHLWKTQKTIRHVTLKDNESSLLRVRLIGSKYLMRPSRACWGCYELNDHTYRNRKRTVSRRDLLLNVLICLFCHVVSSFVKYTLLITVILCVRLSLIYVL
jgi:hypothetical protein